MSNVSTLSCPVPILDLTSFSSPLTYLSLNLHCETKVYIGGTRTGVYVSLISSFINFFIGGSVTINHSYRKRWWFIDTLQYVCYITRLRVNGLWLSVFLFPTSESHNNSPNLFRYTYFMNRFPLFEIRGFWRVPSLTTFFKFLKPWTPLSPEDSLSVDYEYLVIKSYHRRLTSVGPSKSFITTKYKEVYI